MATLKEDKNLPQEEAKLEKVDNGIVEDGKGSDE